MKHTPILILLLLLSADLFSQESKSADSLFFFEQTQKQLSFMKLNPTTFINNTENQIGLVSLRYGDQRGGLRNAQMPPSSNDITFSADGIRKLGRLKLYGDFTYTRMKQSDLSNLLRGEDIDDEPFYYFAGKSSDFQRQKYDAKGIISYEVLKNKLYFSSGFNYIYYLSDRSVDPRMSLNWFDFKARPELTWVTKNFSIGLSGLLGYGIENTNIKYKKIDYSNGNIEPDRVNYINYGYGLMRRLQDNFSRRKDYKGGGIHLTADYNSWNALLNIDYISSKDINRKSLDASLKSTVYSEYESNKIESQLLMTRKKGGHVQQIAAAYSYLLGEDFLNLVNAKNYTAKNASAQLSYSDLQSTGRNSFEWGVHTNYAFAYKKDASAGHLFQYSYLQPGFKAGYYHIVPGKYRFSAIAAPSLILPVQTEVTVPSTQEVQFTRSIVYPDYAYRKITSGSLDLKLQYITQMISSDFRTGITVNAGLIKALRKPAIEFPAQTLPGNYRLSTNIAINLYF